MVEVIVCKDDNEITERLLGELSRSSTDGKSSSGNFTLAVSGGTVLKYLSLALESNAKPTEHWKIFFCDERCVPYDDKESTYGQYKSKLIDKGILNRNNFYPVDTHFSVNKAAESYESLLRNEFPDEEFPRFEMVLLGIGVDGHTCSLFPGDESLNERKAWVLPITKSPKPPPERTTLTFPVLNAAKRIIFLVSGKEKAVVVKNLLKDKIAMPANLVKPDEGTVTWLLDADSASLL